MKKKVRLIDVAERAGVSKTTASHYLNHRYNTMSLDTRYRLHQAVKELNYIPNNIARSLKTNKTRTLGVIVRDFSSYYTSYAVRGMDDFCKKHNYDLLIYNSDFDSKIEENALRTLCQMNVDGIIISSCGTNTELIEEISKNTIPIVQFQLEHDDCDTSIIVADYKRASFDATEYLIGLGHTRISFVTQPFNSVKSRKEKYQGFIDAHVKHNIPFDTNLIQYWTRQTGLMESPLKLLNTNNPPTAIFTQQLAITRDVLRELESANIEIPKQVSLLGSEEIPMVEFFKVPITTIQQKPYEVGAETVRLLIDKLKQPSISNAVSNTRILISCTLDKRASCDIPFNLETDKFK